MKRRRLEQIERRRELVELNLAEESARSRLRARRTGCMSLFSVLIAVGAAGALAAAGLR